MLLMTRRKEIHRGRSTYGRYIVGFDIIDNVAEGVQTFLDCVVDLVVDGSDRIGYLAGGDQVGGAPFKPMAKE